MKPCGCWTKNRGTYPPKWMVNIMENPIKHGMIWGYHYFWKHPCQSSGGFVVFANKNNTLLNHVIKMRLLHLCLDLEKTCNFSTFCQTTIHLTQPVDPEKKFERLIFPTKYVVPKSLSRLATGWVRHGLVLLSTAKPENLPLHFGGSENANFLNHLNIHRIWGNSQPPTVW